MTYLPAVFALVLFAKKHQKMIEILICMYFWFLFFPSECSTSKRIRCDSKWPQLYGNTCASASVCRSCTHSDPGRPEGAVGGEVWVPALLYWILRGTGERVAFPLPLLPERRRWARAKCFLLSEVPKSLQSTCVWVSVCVCLGWFVTPIWARGPLGPASGCALHLSSHKPSEAAARSSR